MANIKQKINIHQKNNQNGKNDNSAAKYIFIGVLVLVLGYLAYVLFIKKEEVETPVVVKPPVQQTPVITDTVFTNEGNVTFLKKGNKKVLHKVNIEVSDEDRERAQGLMYRSHMGDDQGMIFIFPRSEPQSFWMKNTKIPLDIIYINEQNEIVKIYKQTKPFNTTSLPSGKNAMYVVEINGGLTDKFGITEGDIIEFKKN